MTPFPASFALATVSLFHSPLSQACLVFLPPWCLAQGRVPHSCLRRECLGPGTAGVCRSWCRGLSGQILGVRMEGSWDATGEVKTQIYASLCKLLGVAQRLTLSDRTPRRVSGRKWTVGRRQRIPGRGRQREQAGRWQRLEFCVFCWAHTRQPPSGLCSALGLDQPLRLALVLKCLFLAKSSQM